MGTLKGQLNDRNRTVMGKLGTFTELARYRYGTDLVIAREHLEKIKKNFR